jgi:hypothetical protein
LLLACALSQAHAADFQMRNWQPCPNVLDDQNGKEPEEDARWSLTLSPYTHHWTDSADYKHVRLVGLERNVSGGRFCGLALFTNSFGQPSGYLYAGKQWNGLMGSPRLFFKLSAGVIYGYEGEHKGALMFSHAGFAPVIIPAFGYDFTDKDSVNVAILGTAGVLFAYGRRF